MHSSAESYRRQLPQTWSHRGRRLDPEKPRGQLTGRIFVLDLDLRSKSMIWILVSDLKSLTLASEVVLGFGLQHESGLTFMHNEDVFFG